MGEPAALAYELADPHNKRWTDQAYGLLTTPPKSPPLRVGIKQVGQKPQVPVVIVEGQCPRCKHHFVHAAESAAAIVEVAAPLIVSGGRKVNARRKRSSGPPAKAERHLVACRCTHPHEGRPEEANGLGCGIDFAIEFSDDAGGEVPVKEFELPSSGPHALDLKNNADWEVLVESSFERATANASKWQAGMVGIFAGVSGLLIVKGPDAIADLSYWPQVLVAVAIAVSVLTFIVSATLLVNATDPRMKLGEFKTTVSDFVTLRAHALAATAQTLRRRKVAGFWMSMALGAFAAAALLPILASVFAPLESEQFVKVTLVSSDHPVCGALVASSPTEQGKIVIQSDSTETVRVLAFANVAAVEVVESCE